MIGCLSLECRLAARAYLFRLHVCDVMQQRVFCLRDGRDLSMTNRISNIVDTDRTFFGIVVAHGRY